MISTLLFAGALVALGSLVLVWVSARRATLAYEDTDGFHYGRPEARLPRPVARKEETVFAA
ncbi:MAG TPA: hypothetical protein PLU52_04505 [Opitutaceae bacterium]|nr:hypothetical protein [Opitutaceae bacterium]HND61673.1 hypothetical protein [Opitutaceae bacterium]